MSETKKLLLTALPVTPEQKQALEALGYDIDICPDNQPVPADIAANAQVIVCFRLFGSNALSDFPKLRYVQSVATGVEALPLKELAKTDIRVGKGKNLYSIPMAEWTVCRLLEHYKKSRHFAALQREHRWEKASWVDYKSNLEELFGKKVGICGTGDIALALCRLLRGFEVSSIVGMNSDGRPVEGYDACFAPHQLCDMVKDCDIVVSLAPLTPQSEGMFDEKVISCMKQGAVLVSLSRGKLVNTAAVRRGLESGRLGALIADVLAEEPLKPDNPLWDMENVYLTPHNSFITDQRYVRLFELVYQNLKHYALTGKPRDEVDLSKGY